MFKSIAEMYITMMPLIIAGILNMVFTKTKLYQEHKNPIDGNRLWKDGKRIFGDHKTWIGFLSMVIICGITQIAWGVVCQNANLNLYNDIYDNYDNTLLYNTIIGLITGFGYMIAELPNSFVKRRLDIASGKTDSVIPNDMIFIGEVGLGGELRSIANLEKRLIEAANLGFTAAVVPKKSLRGVKVPDGLEVYGVSTVVEAIRLFKE